MLWFSTPMGKALCRYWFLLVILKVNSVSTIGDIALRNILLKYIQSSVKAWQKLVLRTLWKIEKV